MARSPPAQFSKDFLALSFWLIYAMLSKIIVLDMLYRYVEYARLALDVVK